MYWLRAGSRYSSPLSLAYCQATKKATQPPGSCGSGSSRGGSTACDGGRLGGEIDREHVPGVVPRRERGKRRPAFGRERHAETFERHGDLLWDPDYLTKVAGAKFLPKSEGAWRLVALCCGVRAMPYVMGV